MSRCDLDLWPSTLNICCRSCVTFIRLCAKFERNRIIHGWVIYHLFSKFLHIFTTCKNEGSMDATSWALRLIERLCCLRGPMLARCHRLRWLEVERISFVTYNILSYAVCPSCRVGLLACREQGGCLLVVVSRKSTTRNRRQCHVSGHCRSHAPPSRASLTINNTNKHRQTTHTTDRQTDRQTESMMR